jgi:hypothetical protein
MAAGPTSIVERLLEDDYVHEQLGVAAAQIGSTYRRVRSRSGRDAVTDQKLVDQIREAAVAAQRAARGLFAEPEPEPRRRGRWLAGLAVLAGVGWVARELDRAERQRR